MNDRTTINENKRKEVCRFLFLLALFAAACAFRYFDHAINPQDTTAFAFSYRYGFISRGLMGTLLELFDGLIPGNQMTYDTIYLWSGVATLFFFVCLFVFYYVVLMKRDGIWQTRQQYLVILLSVFAFPMFVTEENFGRLDVYLTILMLLCMILLVVQKAEWLVLPLCCVGVLIHQGFVFMNVNIVLVLLFYRLLTQEGAKKRYYLILFVLTAAAVSGLFLYFEFFSHVNGPEIYDEVVANAKALAMDGKTYSTALVNHEILGEGVFMDEWFFHKINYQELPQFLVFFAPYIYIGVRYGRSYWKKAKNAKEKWIAAAVLLGAWTVLPEFILKVDYGRYMYEIVFYYIAMVLCLMAMGDRYTEETTEEMSTAIGKHMPAALFLIVYPMIMMPFLDVVISQLNVVLCRLFLGVS